MGELETPYEFRARHCGAYEWLCPFCGTYNKSRLHYTSWRVRCKNKRCGRDFVRGDVLYPLDAMQRHGGRMCPPRDLAFPQPCMVVEGWRYGDRAHRVVSPAAETVAESED